MLCYSAIIKIILNQAFQTPACITVVKTVCITLYCNFSVFLSPKPPFSDFSFILSTLEVEVAGRNFGQVSLLLPLAPLLLLLEDVVRPRPVQAWGPSPVRHQDAVHLQEGGGRKQEPGPGRRGQDAIPPGERDEERWLVSIIYHFHCASSIYGTQIPQLCQ